MNKPANQEARSPKDRQRAPLLTPTDLKPAATKDIAAAMNGILATASSIEVWIDETERRTWFLFEAGRPGDATGH